MEQLVELLKQIQELAGVAIDALEGAAGDKGKPEGKPEGGPPKDGGGPPKDGGGPPRDGGGPPPPDGGGPPPEEEKSFPPRR